MSTNRFISRVLNTLLMSLCVLGITAFSCNGDDDVREPDTVPVSGITVSPNSIILLEGGTSMTVKAEVSPANASDKTVTWSSSNESVATVSDGTITPKGAGTAIITAKAGGKTATCDVTVKASNVSVTGVSLDKNSIDLTVGGTEMLTATVTPDDATNKKLKWISSDNSRVSLEIIEGNKVKVIAQGPGMAKITVTTEDGGKTASCMVVVKEETVSVTGVSLNKSTLSLTVGGSETLVATVLPSNATNKNVKWSTSSATIATVVDGKVTAVKAGTAKITVTTEDGSKTASCTVTVTSATVAVTSISLNKSSLSLTVGGSETLVATVLPSNATNKNVKWSTSSATVATVVDGKVTAVKAGTAKITATTEDGSKTASCTVTVNSATVSVTSVSLDKSTLTLREGEWWTLEATVNPSNATNKTVNWSSSNTAVATVSGGKVTAVKAGTATIKATTADGGKTASCTVTVTSKTVAVTSVTLNKSTLSLVEGTSETLTATVNPSNATNKTVNWISTNTYVATVSNGKVTALMPGTADIKVTTVDGGKTAYCSVTVTEFAGSGTSNDPYLIYTKADLKKLGDKVYSGKQYSRMSFKLMNNIDLGGSSSPWSPIGRGSYSFGGNFDGNNKTISGLYINQPSSNDQGLFGSVGGDIKNLTVKGSVTGNKYCGGVAGSMYGGSFSNCSSDVVVKGASTCGGIVGYLSDGSFEKCVNRGTVTASSSVGGIVGSAGGRSDKILNCSNRGSVTGEQMVGGIVGINTDGCEVFGCLNEGSVTGSGSGGIIANIGGIIGMNQASRIVSCKNKGNIAAGKSRIIGGIVGNNKKGSSICGCYNLGDVIGDNYVGGVVGYNISSEIVACYNRGTLTSFAEKGGVVCSIYSGTVSYSFCILPLPVVSSRDPASTESYSTSNSASVSQTEMNNGTVLGKLNTGIYIYNGSIPSGTTAAQKYISNASWPALVLYGD